MFSLSKEMGVVNTLHANFYPFDLKKRVKGVFFSCGSFTRYQQYLPCFEDLKKKNVKINFQLQDGGRFLPL